MSDLAELYQEMILDHGKHPRNVGELPDANHRAVGHNPLCGDKLALALKVDGDIIEDVKFSGSGCAISMASASIMTQSIMGQPVSDARALFETFVSMVTGQSSPDPESLGKLAVFAGVSEFPVRVKCATLPWHTLQSALNDQGAPATTE